MTTTEDLRNLIDLSIRHLPSTTYVNQLIDILELPSTHVAQFIEVFSSFLLSRSSTTVSSSLLLFSHLIRSSINLIKHFPLKSHSIMRKLENLALSKFKIQTYKVQKGKMETENHYNAINLIHGLEILYEGTQYYSIFQMYCVDLAKKGESFIPSEDFLREFKEANSMVRAVLESEGENSGNGGNGGSSGGNIKFENFKNSPHKNNSSSNNSNNNSNFKEEINKQEVVENLKLFQEILKENENLRGKELKNVDVLETLLTMMRKHKNRIEDFLKFGIELRGFNREEGEKILVVMEKLEGEYIEKISDENNVFGGFNNQNESNNNSDRDNRNNGGNDMFDDFFGGKSFSKGNNGNRKNNGGNDPFDNLF